MKELKRIVICPNCETPNLKKDLLDNEVAVCHNCGEILYKNYKFIEIKIFLLTISGFVFFFIAMFFPIVNINIVGYEENLRIVEASLFLFSKGYIFISLFVFLSIFLFPFICLMLYFIGSLLLVFKYKKEILKKILILIMVIRKWCFLDIFFIAILVSLVKIFSYATIEFNVGFIAYILFLAIMFYILKIIGVEVLWEKYENI